MQFRVDMEGTATRSRRPGTALLEVTRHISRTWPCLDKCVSLSTIAFVSCTLAGPVQLGLDQEHTVQQQSELNKSGSEGSSGQIIES
jgi:hypothetical protein